jgi:hypothetical protein
MNPGNLSWLPSAFSKRALRLFHYWNGSIHTGSGDQAKGRPPTVQPRRVSSGRDFAAVLAQIASYPDRI